MKYHTCPTCDEELELCEDNFHKDKNSPTGFVSRCKTCSNEIHRRHYVPKFLQRTETGRIDVVTAFDEVCERDRQKRDIRSTISIFQKAF